MGSYQFLRVLYCAGLLIAGEGKAAQMLSPFVGASCGGQVVWQIDVHMTQLEKVGWVGGRMAIILREEAAEESVSTDYISVTEKKRSFRGSCRMQRNYI